MSSSSSKPKSNAKASASKPTISRRLKLPIRRDALLLALGFPFWVFLGFMLAQFVAIGILRALQWAGLPLKEMNEATLSFTAGVLIYAIAIAIVIGVPRFVWKARTSAKDLGLQRLPTWRDFVWVPAGALGYLALTLVVSVFGMLFLTFVDYSQVQNTGFGGMSHQYEYALAFITLVILAPFAEETLFRGYLFGKLRKYVPLWLAILITSLLFAVVHGQWNVGLDVFALSIILCLLRVVSGSLWPSIMLHMLKNGVAFYLLFIK